MSSGNFVAVLVAVGFVVAAAAGLVLVVFAAEEAAAASEEEAASSESAAVEPAASSPVVELADISVAELAEWEMMSVRFDTVAVG